MSFKTSIYKLTIRQSVVFKQKGFQWRHRKHHDVRVPGHLSLSLSRADRCISVQKLISFKLFPWIGLSLGVFETTLVLRNIEK